jgi:hypothetical protein
MLFAGNIDVIDGLLMDATWKIGRSDVSSILTFSMDNVGTPVALALRPKGDRAISDIFYVTVCPTRW